MIEEHEKLYQVLAHEKLVLYYDKVIASIMLTSAETAPILANKHLGKDTSNVILPRNLSQYAFHSRDTPQDPDLPKSVKSGSLYCFS